MRITREEALRALQLLEEYQRRLPRGDDPKASGEERDLSLAIDRIIRVFKSNFFHALLDIQQFYAVSLLDEQQQQQQHHQQDEQQQAHHHHNHHRPHHLQQDDKQEDKAIANEVQQLLGGKLSEILGAVLKHQKQQEQNNSLTRPPVKRNSFVSNNLPPEDFEEQLPETFYNRNVNQQQQLNGNAHQAVADQQFAVPSSYRTNLTQEHFNSTTTTKTLAAPYLGQQAHNEEEEDDDDDFSPEEEVFVSEKEDDKEDLMSRRYNHNTTSNNNNNNLHQTGYQVRPQSAVSTSEVVGLFPPPEKEAAMSYNTYNASSSHSETTTTTSGSNWEYEEITLERGNTGLGFSIAGGVDNPHVPDDNSIYITKLIPGGSAAIDGRIQVEDIILKVNRTALVDVKHQVAVEALKHAGNRVHLFVKRRPKVVMMNMMASPVQQPKLPVSMSAPAHMADGDLVKIELFKATSKGLGFTIGGGVGNESRPGDVAIYVTKIMDKGAAALDGRLEVGDRLVAVNDVNLEGAAHEDAVNALKATSDHVILVVVKSHQEKLPATSAKFPSRNSLHSLQGNSATDRFSKDLEDQLDSVQPGNGEIDREPRRVSLKKGNQGLGFNIVGGEDGEGIFISFILAGGAADLCGELYRGDQLLAVSGFDLSKATHEQAAAALKGAGQTVSLLVAYRPEEYRRFEAKIAELREQQQQHQNHLSMGTLKTSQKKSLYVRALFDYDPNRDSGLPSRGLSFRFGNILHVTNASDDEWWQARRVASDDKDDSILGIIPSKRRVERRERARLKSVKFHGNNDYSDGTTGPGGASSASTLDRKKKNFSFSRRFPFMKSRESSNEDISASSLEHLRKGTSGYGHDSSEHIDRSSMCGSNSALEDIREDPNGGGGQYNILSYEAVVRTQIDYMRPVVILGPLKERFNDDLISEYPNQFASCVPHTTRPRREGEEDGRDYHFVTSREEMERDIKADLFIECGTFRDNLYGTSFRAVEDVARNQQKHCILDVSALAIPRLQQAGLHPVAILIRPKTLDLLHEWDKRMSDDEAAREFEKAMTNEAKYGQFFTAILSGDTPEDVYAKVKLVLYDNMGEFIWVPAKNQKI